ncbi:MAG: nucleotidyltransferase domain-containing protein [Anaerolineae bacterium]
MTINQNLVTRLRRVLPDILRDTPVKLAYLYGSVATGEALPTSDVDIGLVLWYSPPNEDFAMQPKERLHLEFAVEEALERQGIFKADVRVIDDLPLTFRGEVVTHGIRLYSRDETARVEFETRTWREYLDFQPVARMMRQAFFDDVRAHGLSRRRDRG